MPILYKLFSFDTLSVRVVNHLNINIIDRYIFIYLSKEEEILTQKISNYFTRESNW